MTDKPDTTGISRRHALKYGALASGNLLFGRRALAKDSAENVTRIAESTQASLESRIRSHGHYAWFPGEPNTWGRSKTPFDVQRNDLYWRRWMTHPTDDGGVRCLVENLPNERNAGFDVHLGRLGEISEVTITAESILTQRGTSPAVLAIALYLDKNDDDEFFEWDAHNGNGERFVDSNGDDEGLLFSGARGQVTIDGDTAFHIVTADQAATLNDLKDGSIDGIDQETSVALYVGVTGSGIEAGREEAVIREIDVQRW